VIGIDPSPFTYRELVWMATGRRMHDWDQVAYTLATIAAIAGAKDVSPRDFHPMCRDEPDTKPKRRAAQIRGAVSALKRRQPKPKEA